MATHVTLTRRDFLRNTMRTGAGAVALGAGGSMLLAACPAPQEEGAIVGDVVDFALTPDDWQGEFGFVTLRLHRGMVDGEELYYIQTDISDQDLAAAQELVFVPKLAALDDPALSGALYLVDEQDEAVLTTHPGRDDYTPACRLYEVSWQADPRPLGSAEEVEAAAEAGEVEVAETGAVINAMACAWPGGEMPADDELLEYLGPGQLIEPADRDGLTVTFKLHECFPESWYIVTDTSLGPMAEDMHVAHSPRLDGATDAGGTGRVNVLMGGLEGPGPMGDQPSVFDFPAGDTDWSPFWDHFVYAWREDAEPRLLTTEDEIHEARDAGELDEFPGAPPTEGEIFVVNCPVPVLAANRFEA